MDERQDKTIYSAKIGEIASKNFVAGISRSMGGFVVTLISWGVIYLIIIKLILPQMSGTIDQLTNVLKLLPKSSSATTTSVTTNGTSIQLPENIMNQIQQLQK